jgi:hypothetical protein
MMPAKEQPASSESFRDDGWGIIRSQPSLPAGQSMTRRVEAAEVAA